MWEKTYHASVSGSLLGLEEDRLLVAAHGARLVLVGAVGELERETTRQQQVLEQEKDSCKR